ncbi:MAG: diguanylate cyclase [Burkholderiales bacterium]
MAEAKNQPPSAVARETLIRLAQQRLAPTPDHYAEIYSQISGTEEGACLRAPKLLAELAAALDKGEGPVALAARQFSQKVAQAKWDEAAIALNGLLQVMGEAPDTDWGKLIRDLLAAMETRHTGITAARKQAAVAHVTRLFRREPRKVHEKLSALVQSWGEPASAGQAGAAQAEPMVTSESPAAAAGKDAEQGGAGGTPTAVTATHSQSEALSRELASLITLLIENVGELVADDQWLAGQVARVRELMSGPVSPLTVRAAHRAMRELIYRQGVLHHSLAETRVALKEMITLFISRLGRMVDTTSDFGQEMETLTKEIESTNDFSQLGRLVREVAQKSRNVQAEIIRTRDELLAEQARAAENLLKVRMLEDELDALSQRVNEDALTAALNRRGLDRAFEIESACAARDDRPMTLALLDVDNFKALNDRLGHGVGDAALRHLVDCVRDAIRPADVVARFGGEEFVILLPNADLDAAGEVMQRVQRALTRRFFLNNNEKVLITFSAGIALWQKGEAQEQIIARADAALYRAKKAGKNRVVVAESAT